MRKLLATLLLGGLLAGTAGCDLLDPTHVENPNILERTFLQFPDPTAAWLRGLERQVAVVLDEAIVPAEIASDNYVNTQTFFNQFMDRLLFNFTDQDIREVLNEISELRESAEFGLTRVVDADQGETPSQVAELWFFKGYAHLMLGEFYHLAPADSAGAPITSQEQFQEAAEAFNQAITLTTDNAARVGYRIVLARTYRNLGDRTNAVAQAQQAIEENPDYVRFAQYDQTNGPNSDIKDALYDRGSFDDLQPLPRLDFLDPKYFLEAEPHANDDEDTDVAYVKGEEAYLILAEAQLAASDLNAARQTLRDLLDVVAERPTSELADVTEGRTQARPGTRPDSPEWQVASSPGESFQSGLVISRTSTERVPVISGTSVTEADIALANTVEEALELVYLMRQEIFLAEGRRMADLGIKWPVPEREVISNPNIEPGGPATVEQLPSFIPPQREMDTFTMDATAKQVTIMHDMNEILVENRASDLVVPFF